MNYPGFQKTAQLRVDEIYPGDDYGGRCITVAGTNGLLAISAVTVGNAVFIAANGNQAASNITDAGSSVVAGIVLRNHTPLGWDATLVGYGYTVIAGSALSVGCEGKFGAIISGVNGSGTLDHTPVFGEQIWVKTTDGSFACAPAAVTTVTGYVKAPGWRVNRVGMYNGSYTIATNTTLGLIVGKLEGM